MNTQRLHERTVHDEPPTTHRHALVGRRLHAPISTRYVCACVRACVWVRVWGVVVRSAVRAVCCFSEYRLVTATCTCAEGSGARVSPSSTHVREIATRLHATRLCVCAACVRVWLLVCVMTPNPRTHARTHARPYARTPLRTYARPYARTHAGQAKISFCARPAVLQRASRPAR